MDYRDEIKKLLDTVDQESILRFIYALLKVAASDPELYGKLLGNAFR